MAFRVCIVLIAAAMLFGCSPQSPGSTTSPNPPPQGSPIRVLMLTATRGFRHDSIATARDVMTTMASSGEFAVTVTEEVPAITRASLASYDVLGFVLTTGELPFDPAQKSAILDFVSGGKGFIGIHSASDTLYSWPDYGTLVGAYFREHPWTQAATVLVETQSHPATAGLGDRFVITDEFYTFRDNPQGPQVLLRLDPLSVGAAGDYPLAWAHSYGAGRSYYNALGHFDATWRDARFQRQIAGAIRWAAQR
jgi:type 1 glutamine amidotransferase